VGGHSRLVERWIRSDQARLHSLVLTSPLHDLPSALRDVVAASGGEVHRLAPGSSSFARRARELQQLATGFDIVVLHHNPFDPVPVAALA
jgi:hypothetical protein